MERQHTESMFDGSELTHLDSIAWERRARQLQAQAIGEGFSLLGAWISRRIAALRGSRARQAA
jgi:hypothetical protein